MIIYDAEKIVLEEICEYLNDQIQNPNVCAVSLIFSDKQTPLCKENSWHDLWVFKSEDTETKMQKIEVTVRLKEKVRFPYLFSFILIKLYECYWKMTKGEYVKESMKDPCFLFNNGHFECVHDNDDEITEETNIASLEQQGQ
jgi:hypothetical protein